MIVYIEKVKLRSVNRTNSEALHCLWGENGFMTIGKRGQSTIENKPISPKIRRPLAVFLSSLDELKPRLNFKGPLQMIAC